MKIIRSGSNPSAPGPQDWFTGTVRIDPLFAAEEPGRTAFVTHVLDGARALEDCYCYY